MTGSDKHLVVDASAVVDMVVAHRRGREIAETVLSQPAPLHAPQLLDVEVVSALRHLRNRHVIDDETAQAGYERFRLIRIHRHEHSSIIDRVFALRDAFSAYDATYVALAELLDATLVTADARLARGCNHLVMVEPFG